MECGLFSVEQREAHRAAMQDEVDAIAALVPELPTEGADDTLASRRDARVRPLAVSTEPAGAPGDFTFERVASGQCTDDEWLEMRLAGPEGQYFVPWLALVICKAATERGHTPDPRLRAAAESLGRVKMAARGRPEAPTPGSVRRVRVIHAQLTRVYRHWQAGLVARPAETVLLGIWKACPLRMYRACGCAYSADYTL